MKFTVQRVGRAKTPWASGIHSAQHFCTNTEPCRPIPGLGERSPHLSLPSPGKLNGLFDPNAMPQDELLVVEECPFKNGPKFLDEPVVFLDYRLLGEVVGPGGLYLAPPSAVCGVPQSPSTLAFRRAQSPVSQRFPTHGGSPKTRRPSLRVTE